MNLRLFNKLRTAGAMKKNVKPLKRMWPQSWWEKHEVITVHLVAILISEEYKESGEVKIRTLDLISCLPSCLGSFGASR
jgi:hypothetical protein